MASSNKHKRYSKKIKLEAIRRVLEEDEPVQVVCDSLGIRHRDNIYEWIKKYRKHGEAAFGRSVGRPKKEDVSQSTDEKVDQLRIEVDALKKYLEILRQGG
ncbi:transposase [Lentibacillus sp. Marseille-P4043]|uniref:transposase n=1 Tax=Lentibacillus sp. Marseille-P4043 TaxID=2040293 RepID=UPI000D0AD5A7|nr:transposase [Lentibacillus sp. Marseille-P4043]